MVSSFAVNAQDGSLKLVGSWDGLPALDGAVGIAVL